MKSGFRSGMIAAAVAGLAFAPAAQAQYRNEIPHNPGSCASGGPKIKVLVTGVKVSKGTVRAQVYNGTKADWLQSGRWLTRVEAPARAGTMTFCLPVAASGTYAVAVRHDVNNNGKTDLSEDGGAMSNNPSINIFNLGKPSVTKTAFAAGNGVTTITINMKYR